MRLDTSTGAPMRPASKPARLFDLADTFAVFGQYLALRLRARGPRGACFGVNQLPT